ncbi:hypothetical protein [Acetobacter pasteurianus]|nr:hypothetical protein [Acetobacter pasteurianus]
MMGKAHPTEKLWVARHSFVNPGHTDEDKTDTLSIEQVTQPFQRRHA